MLINYSDVEYTSNIVDISVDISSNDIDYISNDDYTSNVVGYTIQLTHINKAVNKIPVSRSRDFFKLWQTLKLILGILL